MKFLDTFSPCYILHIAILYLKAHVSFLFLEKLLVVFVFFFFLISLKSRYLWLKYWKDWSKPAFLRALPEQTC